MSKSDAKSVDAEPPESLAIPARLVAGEETLDCALSEKSQPRWLPTSDSTARPTACMTPA